MTRFCEESKQLQGTDRAIPGVCEPKVDLSQEVKAAAFVKGLCTAGKTMNFITALRFPSLSSDL